MTRPSVLYVDDDRSNLLAMQYALGDALDIRIAASGDEALELGEGIDVLIADQRMPGMSGVEVCRLFREAHPHATRILYTAYADAHAGVAAINEGGVSHLLIKPVVNEELLAAILESHESRCCPTSFIESIVESGPDRAQRSLALMIGRGVSPVMSVLYDDASDRELERALRTLVVSLQAGSTSSPLALSQLAGTGIPIDGEAHAALDLDSILHALILLEPNRIELHEMDDLVRVVFRTNSVARETLCVASAILERGGGHVVARDGDLILTAKRERGAIVDARAPRLRAPTVDVLIVGDHSAYRESTGDLSVRWTDPDGALRSALSARVVLVDERRYDASLCHRLRSRGASSLILRASELDFRRHRPLAGVITRLIHDGHSIEERHAILMECVEEERAVEATRESLFEAIRSDVTRACTDAEKLEAELAARAEPLLTSQALREAWRSCEHRACPST